MSFDFKPLIYQYISDIINIIWSFEEKKKYIKVLLDILSFVGINVINIWMHVDSILWQLIN